MLEDFFVEPTNPLQPLQEFDLLTRRQGVETFEQGSVARADRPSLGLLPVEPVQGQMQGLFDMPCKYLANRLFSAQAAGNITGLPIQNLGEQSLSAPTWKLLVEYAPQALFADSAHMLHFDIVWTSSAVINDRREPQFDRPGNVAPRLDQGPIRHGREIQAPRLRFDYI